MGSKVEIVTPLMGSKVGIVTPSSGSRWAIQQRELLCPQTLGLSRAGSAPGTAVEGDGVPVSRATVLPTLCILQMDVISGKHHYNTPERSLDAAVKPKLQLRCLGRFVGAHVCGDGRWDMEAVGGGAALAGVLEEGWDVGDGHSQTQLSCILEAGAG